MNLYRREAVEVSRELFEELREVRRSGQVNMFDRRAVIKYAEQQYLVRVCTWARHHPIEYARGVLYGFTSGANRDESRSEAVATEDRTTPSADPN